MYTTLGIDIGKSAVRLVVCQVDAGRIEFDQVVSFPIPNDPHGLDTALSQASAWIAQYKKMPIDASGMTVDPTMALSVHRLMPFNDLRTIENIMPMELSEIWTIDASRLLAYEIGEYIKPTAAKTSEEGEESVDEGGYDIRVINYPVEDLSDLLGKLKAHDIDPHVVLPANEVMLYAMQGVLGLPEEGWGILDIGESKSMLTVGLGNKIHQTRSFKMGGASIDHVLMDVFELSESDSCCLKESLGFLAIPGREYEVFEAGSRSRALMTPEGLSLNVPEWTGMNGRTCLADPSAIAHACAQGINVLATAVRQTLAGFAAKNPAVQTFNLYITGGGSKLYGLTDWMQAYLDVPCKQDVPVNIHLGAAEKKQFSLEAACAAIAAARNIDSACTLNLRRGPLAHKGNLAYLKDNAWLIASLVIGVICVIVCMMVTQTKTIESEHAKLKSALEDASQNVFGKKMLKYNQIEAEIADSEGFAFIPQRTAFTHFTWISSQVNDNLSDVEMDLNSLEIDTQRKIVTIRGEVAGDDGLPRFMQLLEQYECFPNEIPEPKTSKVKERTAFTLRVDANQCKMGGDSE